MRSLRPRPRASCLLGGLVLGIAAGALVAPAAAESPGGRIALVVFVSYRVGLPMALNPTEVRLTAAGAVADALENRGLEVVTYPEVETTMRRWRVRSERDLSAEFLADVASEYAADRLMVASVAVYRDRMIVPARALRADTGQVVWADVGERTTFEDRWIDPETALANLEYATLRIAEQLAAGWRERPDAPSWRVLTLLPLRPVGLEPGLTEVATHCLLRSLLELGDWAVPDPALVALALRDEGFDPYLLEPGSRGMLASRFGAESLLVPRLAAFDPDLRSVPPQAAFTADEPDLSLGAELGAEVPVYYSLSRVDCATGRVLSGTGLYLARQEAEGIFGLPRDVRVAGRYQEGTDELVRSLVRARS